MLRNYPFRFIPLHKDPHVIRSNASLPMALLDIILITDPRAESESAEGLSSLRPLSGIRYKDTATIGSSRVISGWQSILGVALVFKGLEGS